MTCSDYASTSGILVSMPFSEITTWYAYDHLLLHGWMSISSAEASVCLFESSISLFVLLGISGTGPTEHPVDVFYFRVDSGYNVLMIFRG